MYRDIKINETSRFFEDFPIPLVADDAGVYRICLPLKKYTDACYIKVTAMRADGRTVTDGAYINGDTAYYVMAKNMYAVSGKLDLRISLLNTDNNALTTKIMTFDVLETWEDGIDGENRYPIIYEALITARAAQQAADKNKINIENEADDRSKADFELSVRLDKVESDVANEISARKKSDTATNKDLGKSAVIIGRDMKNLSYFRNENSDFYNFTSTNIFIVKNDLGSDVSTLPYGNDPSWFFSETLQSGYYYALKIESCPVSGADWSDGKISVLAELSADSKTIEQEIYDLLVRVEDNEDRIAEDSLSIKNLQTALGAGGSSGYDTKMSITTVVMTSRSVTTSGSNLYETITTDIAIEQDTKKYYQFIDSCGAVENIGAGVLYAEYTIGGVDLVVMLSDSGETSGITLESIVPTILNGGSSALHWSGSTWEIIETSEINVDLTERVTSLENRVTALEEGGGGSMQDIMITENGVYTPDYPNKGFGVVTVDVKYTIDEQTDYSYMFYKNCRIDLLINGTLNTSHVQKALYMAGDSSNLTRVKNFDFSSLDDTNHMFYNCSKLTHINDSSTLECPNVIWAESMFSGCSSLVSINKIIMKKLEYAKDMFYSNGFNGVDLTMELSPSVNGYYMFEKAKIKNLTIASDTVINNANSMFLYSNFVSIKGLNLSGVTSASGYSSMFSNTNTVENLELVGEIKDYNISFSGLTRLTHESLINILNALCENGTATCSLGSTNLAKLTDEEKAIATNKGWTLA